MLGSEKDPSKKVLITYDILSNQWSKCVYVLYSLSYILYMLPRGVVKVPPREVRGWCLSSRGRNP